jgi:hypothetical protein
MYPPITLKKLEEVFMYVTSLYFQPDKLMHQHLGWGQGDYALG